LSADRTPFADCLYLVDPGVSRVSGLEYGGYQRIEALPGTKRAPSRKHISSILIKLNLQEGDDDHRRVLAVITFFKAP
jgi:hypothetical protein